MRGYMSSVYVLINKYFIYVAVIAFICDEGTIKQSDISLSGMVKSLQLLRLEMVREEGGGGAGVVPTSD